MAKAKAGSKKHGRNKRRDARKGSALSLFTRGRISASDYFKAEGIKTPVIRG